MRKKKRWKKKIKFNLKKILTDSDSGEGSLPNVQMAASFLCPHMAFPARVHTGERVLSLLALLFVAV